MEQYPSGRIMERMRCTLPSLYDSEREGFFHVMGKGWTHCGDYLLYMDADFAYFENPYNKVIPFHRSGEEFLPEQGFTMEKMRTAPIPLSLRTIRNTSLAATAAC